MNEVDKKKAAIADKASQYLSYQGFKKYKPKPRVKKKSSIQKVSLSEFMYSNKISVQNEFAVQHFKEQQVLALNHDNTFWDKVYATNAIYFIGLFLIIGGMGSLLATIFFLIFALHEPVKEYIWGFIVSVFWLLASIYLFNKVLDSEIKYDQTHWRRTFFHNIQWEPPLSLVEELIAIKQSVPKAEIYIEYLPIDLPEPKHYFVIVSDGEHEFTLGITPSISSTFQ